MEPRLNFDNICITHQEHHCHVRCFRKLLNTNSIFDVFAHLPVLAPGKLTEIEITESITDANRPTEDINKCSAVAAMGDRLATTDTGRKEGDCCAPFREGAVPLFVGRPRWVPIKHNVAWAKA